MTTLNIGNRRELFVDDVLLENMTNTQLKLHEPVSGGMAIKIDKSWEGPANFGMSIIQDGDRLLMYYRGWSDRVNDQNGVGCVAVSEDGEHWEKPALNLVQRDGWTDNNIIATDTGAPEFAFPCAPWVDTRPGVPANEHIKMFKCVPLSGEVHSAMRDPGGAKRLVFYASADGFTFRKLDPQPEFVTDLPNAFDGGNTMFWSEAEQQYVVYFRCMDKPGDRLFRTMARATSRDLLTWSEPELMTYGDTAREQFYVNNTQPYFRAPHIYIAPAARFMESRAVVTPEQAEAIGLVTPGDPEKARLYTQANACSDGVLLTSRPGSTRYDRTFMETFVRPGVGYQNWTARSNYPLTGIFPCGPDKMMMFVTRCYMQPTWHIERLLLRTDGFASVSAPHAGGEMVTRPFTFAGKELELNYRTGAPGFVRVELQDEAGKPMEGYTVDDCPEIIGDEIKRTVAWKNGTDISALAGKPVRLRFVMKDADLFSVKFG